MDIKEVWKVFKMSSMKDTDMQKAFQRAVTANACIKLLEENERLLARVAELEDVVRDVKEYDINHAFSDGRNGFYLLPHEIRVKIEVALEDA